MANAPVAYQFNCPVLKHFWVVILTSQFVSKLFGMQFCWKCRRETRLSCRRDVLGDKLPWWASRVHHGKRHSCPYHCSARQNLFDHTFLVTQWLRMPVSMTRNYYFMLATMPFKPKRNSSHTTACLRTKQRSTSTLLLVGRIAGNVVVLQGDSTKEPYSLDS